MGTTNKLSDSIPALLAVLESGETFSYTPNGYSMMPLIRPGRDTVVFSAVKELRVGDIYLFRRDGAVVLHRLIDNTDEDSLSFLGDGNYIPETGIGRQDVLAVVIKLIRNGREIDFSSSFYRRYADIMTRPGSRSRNAIGKLRSLQLRSAQIIKRRLGLHKKGGDNHGA